jgi:hypothetical protein
MRRSNRLLSTFLALSLLPVVGLVLSACGGQDEPTSTAAVASLTPTIAGAPTAVPTPLIPILRPTPTGAERFFPVTVVVETDKAWLTVASVTRADAVEEEGEATLIVRGSVHTYEAGTFDYRLHFVDSEGMDYPDSSGVLLGALEADREVEFETSVRVPVEATLTRLGYWVEGREQAELTYVIDLPVADISPVPP